MSRQYQHYVVRPEPNPAQARLYDDSWRPRPRSAPPARRAPTLVMCETSRRESVPRGNRPRTASQRAATGSTRMPRHPAGRLAFRPPAKSANQAPHIEGSGGPKALNAQKMRDYGYGMPTWSPFYAPPGAQKANFFHTTSEEWGSFSKTGHLQELAKHIAERNQSIKELIFSQVNPNAPRRDKK